MISDEIDWEEHKRLVSLHKAKETGLTSLIELMNSQSIVGQINWDHKACWGAIMPEMKEFFR